MGVKTAEIKIDKATEQRIIDNWNYANAEVNSPQILDETPKLTMNLRILIDKRDGMAFIQIPSR